MLMMMMMIDHDDALGAEKRSDVHKVDQRKSNWKSDLFVKLPKQLKCGNTSVKSMSTD